jgi:hypothetical protein
MKPEIAQGIAEFEKYFGVPLEQVERLSIVFLDPPPGSEEPLLFIRTVKPYDRKKLSAVLGGATKEEKVKGRTLLVGEKSALALLDDRSFVVPTTARADALRSWLERTPPKIEGALAAALWLAAGKHSVTVGINVNTLNEAIGDKLPGETEPFKPLFQANAATVTFDVGQESRLAVALNFANEKDATAAIKPGEEGLKLLRGGLEQGIAQLSSQEETAQIVKLLKQCEAALKDTRIEQKDKTLRATAQTKLDLAPAGVAVLQAVQKVRAAAARTQSSNNLKQIALAMHNYSDTMGGQMPAQATYDKNGKPLLSWRVMILPYIEQQNLYNQFHMDEPWDSEHNKKLLARMPTTYASPGDEKSAKAHATHYLGFVGKGAFFEGKKGLRFPAEFVDGTSNTIMIVEATKAVPWTKPEDLPYDAGKPLPKLGMPGASGFNASMCDGSVRFISRKVKETTLRNAITRNDGNPLGDDF